MDTLSVSRRENYKTTGFAGAESFSTSTIADPINALHREIERRPKQALLKARACGELLLEAKESVRHGEWLEWLDISFEGSARTARGYMRIARCWEKIRAQWQGDSNFPLNEALKLVRYGYVVKGRA